MTVKVTNMWQSFSEYLVLMDMKDVGLVASVAAIVSSSLLYPSFVREEASAVLSTLSSPFVPFVDVSVKHPGVAADALLYLWTWSVQDFL